MAELLPELCLKFNHDHPTWLRLATNRVTAQMAQGTDCHKMKNGLGLISIVKLRNGSII